MDAVQDVQVGAGGEIGVAAAAAAAEEVVAIAAPPLASSSTASSAAVPLAALSLVLNALLQTFPGLAGPVAAFDEEWGAGASAYATTVVAALILLGCAGAALRPRESTLGGALDDDKVGRRRHELCLFVGPSGGGKTALFHQLCHAWAAASVPSMKAGAATAAAGAGGKQVPVVDYPGHERLRRGLKAYVMRTAVLVVVIDAAATATQLRPTAELLFDLFTDPVFKGKLPPVLVACNKSDLMGARGAPRVRLFLQQELEKMRKTRGTLGSGGGAADAGDDDAALPLGRDGKPFAWADDAPTSVEFVATTAKTADGVAGVRAFVAKHM